MYVYISQLTSTISLSSPRNMEGLGVDAAPEKVGTLEIKSVTPGGHVDRWNQAQPPGSREVVKPGMRVVEVNGRFNSAVGLIAACREAEARASSLKRSRFRKEMKGRTWRNARKPLYLQVK